MKSCYYKGHTKMSKKYSLQMLFSVSLNSRWSMHKTIYYSRLGPELNCFVPIYNFDFKL